MIETLTPVEIASPQENIYSTATELLSAGVEPFFTFLDTHNDDEIVEVSNGKVCILKQYFESHGIETYISVEGVRWAGPEYRPFEGPSLWMNTLQECLIGSSYEKIFKTIAEIRVEALLLGPIHVG